MAIPSEQPEPPQFAEPTDHQLTPPELEARPGLTLRQFTVDDAPALFALIDGNRYHLSKLDDNTAAKYPDLESVVTSITDPPNPDRLRYGIWEGEPEPALAGTINATPRGNGQVGIDYWVGQAFLIEK